MRKQDLIEGVEYAAGSRSRFDTYNRAHVKIVEVDGTREVPGRLGSKVVKRGIVVELMEDSKVHRWYGKAGDIRIVDSARDIQEPWADYASAKADHDRVLTAAMAQSRRLSDVGGDVVARLRALGYVGGVHYSQGRVSIQADMAAEIVARLEER